MSDELTPNKMAAQADQRQRSVRPDPGNTGRERLKPPRLDPTRYGGWGKNGRCIDF